MFTTITVNAMSASGYVKIYGSILGSSVWAEAPATRIVWITLLALADQHGHVEASVSGLARYANVSVRQCEAALVSLSAPDPDSKSPENEGRRIEKVDRGWSILNYLKYRELRSPRQIQTAERQQRFRDRQTGERDASVTERDAALCNGDKRTTVDVDVDEAVAVKSSSSSSSAESRLACRLETDADRLALAAICARVSVPASWIAEASGALEGMHGVTLTPKQLGEALREYVGNGALDNPHFKHFRAYLKRAAIPLKDPKPTQDDTFAALDRWAQENP